MVLHLPHAAPTLAEALAALGFSGLCETLSYLIPPYQAEAGGRLQLQLSRGEQL
jgi:hypothetical protein